MVELKYQLFKNEETFLIEIPYSEFFDPIAVDESYELDGVQKYLELKSYVPVKPEEIKLLQLSLFGECTTQTFYEKGGLLQHTIYSDGSEMMVIQSNLNTEELHSTKLLKSKNGNWQTDSVVVINDESGSVKPVL